jgi:hypothetical protein
MAATTGANHGNYTSLHVMDNNGQMTNMMTLLGDAGGTDLTAATPLIIQDGVISIEDAYVSQATLDTTIATKVDSLNAGTGIVIWGQVHPEKSARPLVHWQLNWMELVH